MFLARTGWGVVRMLKQTTPLIPYNYVRTSCDAVIVVITLKFCSTIACKTISMLRKNKKDQLLFYSTKNIRIILNSVKETYIFFG